MQMISIIPELEESHGDWLEWSVVLLWKLGIYGTLLLYFWRYHDYWPDRSCIPLLGPSNKFDSWSLVLGIHQSCNTVVLRHFCNFFRIAAPTQVVLDINILHFLEWDQVNPMVLSMKVFLRYKSRATATTSLTTSMLFPSC